MHSLVIAGENIKFSRVNPNNYISGTPVNPCTRRTTASTQVHACARHAALFHANPSKQQQVETTIQQNLEHVQQGKKKAVPLSTAQPRARHVLCATRGVAWTPLKMRTVC
jgi:hypothetical protein